MSFRTILVGILAAICGVSATVGINTLNKKKATTTTTVVVARMNIGYGVKVTKDMLQDKEWPANLLPPGSITDADDAIGKYAGASMLKDEPVLSIKLNAQSTNLNIPDGYRGVAILTPDESSAVGRLIVPGNRVDIVLTITQRHEVFGGPITRTLLENVEVLAVGQRFEQSKAGATDAEKDTKSVTLLVKPKMAEDLNLGQQIGRLHLTLRSPTDRTGTEPKTVTTISNLFQEARDRIAGDAGPTNSEITSLTNQIAQFGKKLLNLQNDFDAKLAKAMATKATETAQNAHTMIPAGMRGVTIQTPDESTGVAGLVQPGNRVDVILTLDLRARSVIDHRILNKKSTATSLPLLLNVEVLAVGTKLEESNDGTEPKMTKSITLVVTPKMAEDINLGNTLGSLTLALRGPADSDADEGPLRSSYLDELLQPLPEEEVADAETNGAYRMIRLNRGGFSQDVRVFTSLPAVDQSGATEDSSN